MDNDETLHELFHKVINEYGSEYSKAHSFYEIKEKGVNDKFSSPLADVISKKIPDYLRQYTGIDNNSYKIEGKYGIGRWARVPFVSIFDKAITTSATKGVYVVYLINKDTKEMTLAFQIGATESSEKNDNKRVATGAKSVSANDLAILKKKCSDIRNSIGDKTELKYKADNFIGIDTYDAATIYNVKYKLESLPDDKVLVDDLNKFIKVYKFYREAIFSHTQTLPITNAIAFDYSVLSRNFQSVSSLRYIKSLLAKPFVILTGNSGTGKTRIARNFSKYMEVTDANGEKNWLIVPVGADWTDNVKVLGFYNPLADNGKGKYEKTKILELIERANQNPYIPFFLVLDEMNLSHVERYFSDFLSHMERKDSIFELDGYESQLRYPDNLFVVGTVNIDETTYMFSPKILDRANVIEFKPDKKEVINLFKAEPEKLEIEPADDGVAAAFLKLSREIRNGKYDVQNISQIDVTSRLTEVFGELYDKASEQGFEFAFRTVKEIKQYISAAYELQEDKSKFDLNQAIDEQIVQKILPKIHGNKKEIGNMLDELEKLCNESNMTLSLNKIIQMRGKLNTVQYASFI